MPVGERIILNFPDTSADRRSVFDTDGGKDMSQWLRRKAAARRRHAKSPPRPQAIDKTAEKAPTYKKTARTVSAAARFGRR